MSNSSAIPVKPVDLLILGAGWTSTFLIPLLQSQHVTHAATTTNGRDVAGEPTIPFKFDPASDDEQPFALLPHAKTVLITFPLKGPGQSKQLVEQYNSAHGISGAGIQWIQLGSTGIFSAPHWNDHDSKYDTSDSRAIAEDELLRLPGINSTVLNLAGLYDASKDAGRNPRKWLSRVAKNKEDVRGKKALHLVHGKDVARAILGSHRRSENVKGKRWIVTDLHAYDWWDLFVQWGTGADDDAEEKAEEKELDYAKAVWECMQEESVRALPRGPEILGRVLDSRAFWRAVGEKPGVGRVS